MAFLQPAEKHLNVYLSVKRYKICIKLKKYNGCIYDNLEKYVCNSGIKWMYF